MANGANLTFYKNDYISFCNSNYGKEYSSGDDMFFLKFMQKKGKSIGFNLDQKAIVGTEMPNTFKELFQQRVRWATKASKTTKLITNFFT